MLVGLNRNVMLSPDIHNIPVNTAKVDADKSEEVAALIRDFKPELVMNIALPYQDLTIMDACLKRRSLS